MEELLAHLIGDYVFQTDKQATNKTKSWLQAGLHALTYTAAFLPLTRDKRALSVIFGTHLLIDHLRLAKYPIMWKNAIGDAPQIDMARYDTPTGYAAETPAWMAVWLFIITDNTMHLTINHLALKHLSD